MTNLPTDIDEIKHILGHCPAKSHVCWYSKTQDKLKKDFGKDTDTAERVLAHLQEQAIVLEINKARIDERKLISSEIKMLKSNNDIRIENIEAGNV